jgi:hypothetical protein
MIAKLEKKVPKLVSENSNRFPSLSNACFPAFCRPVFVAVCGVVALAESNSNHPGGPTPIPQDSRDDLVFYFHVLASEASIVMVGKVKLYIVGCLGCWGGC